MSRFSRRVSPKAPLLVRARADPEVFAEFYRQYSRRVVGYYLRRFVNPDTALELTAETFSIALERCQQFRGTTDEEEQGWLFAIARSQLTLYLRRGTVERAAVERLGIATPRWSNEELDRIDDLAGSQLMRSEAAEILGDLPEAQRTVILMRVLDEMGYSAIAEELAVSEDVVRARLSRGLRRMRQALSEEAMVERTS